MRIKTYVLVVAVGLITISAATKDTRPVTGLNPGDLVPGIELTGDQKSFSLQNHSQDYMLLQFWAAYDAESRARNIQLSNEINKLDNESIVMCSVSLDENENIFRETIRIDKLNTSTQFHEQLGKKSEVYRKFKLEKGFRNFLINKDGKILATDVTPEKLGKVLKEI